MEGKGEKFLKVLIIGFFVVLLFFYLYNVIIGSGDVSTLIYLLVASVGLIAVIFFLFGITEKTVSMENFVIFIVVLAVVVVFFVYGSELLPANFSMVSKHLGSVIGLT